MPPVAGQRRTLVKQAVGARMEYTIGNSYRLREQQEMMMRHTGRREPDRAQRPLIPFTAVPAQAAERGQPDRNAVKAAIPPTYGVAGTAVSSRSG